LVVRTTILADADARAGADARTRTRNTHRTSVHIYARVYRGMLMPVVCVARERVFGVGCGADHQQMETKAKTVDN
jgi:hypothetical protein